MLRRFFLRSYRTKSTGFSLCAFFVKSHNIPACYSLSVRRSISTTKIPLFEISGDSPYELGYTHGITLKDRIKSTIDIYYDWLISIGSDDITLQKLCKQYETLMSLQCPSICEEIQGISQGSGVVLWKIYLVNCRTEIFNHLYQQNTNGIGNEVNEAPTECSGIMDISHGVLAQNWDWIQEMHDNAVLLRMKQPTNTILMLTEPGMVGKIGINSNRIGCTLHFLFEPNFFIKNNINQNKTYGLPIHVILRLFLECKTISEIDALLRNITMNTFSCIGVCDDRENGFFLEFCGYNRFEKLYASTKGFSFHTNHYLGCGLNYIGSDEAAMCSLTRYNQLKFISEEKECENVSDCAREILTNDTHEYFPICREFIYEETKDRKVGTITTVIMDLKQGSMNISKGTPLKYPFETVFVDE